MSYYGNVNPELLGIIPLTSQRILELGCGAGALGREFLRRNPEATWVGVEVVEEIGIQARSELHQVLIGDCEAPGFFDQFDQPFDCIVAGDVLEHLRDPWTVLSSIERLLTPSGSLCICVPNIGHISIVKGLLQGKFTYADSGLLDRTHLRFFTRESILQSLKQTGFQPELLIPRRVLKDETAARALLDALDLMTQSPKANQQAFSDLNSFQFVIRSHRQDRSPEGVRLVIAMLAMAPSFADVRTREPLAALGTLPGVKTHYFERDFQIPNYPINVPKIAIVQRQLVLDRDAWALSIEKLHQRGWKIVAEWDDHPDLFAREIRAKFDRHPWASVLMADAVQVSTPALASHIQSVATSQGKTLNLKVVENRVLRVNALERSPVSGRKLRIFLGALNRGDQFSRLLDVILNHPFLENQVEITVISNDTQRAPMSGVTLLPPCDRRTYLNHLSEADICVCPLEDSAANRCKSPVKWLEAASVGTVVLASRVVYGTVIREDSDGLLFDDIQEVPDLIIRLIEAPDEIRRIRNHAAERIRRNFMLANDLDDRIGWYLEVARQTQPLQGS